MERTPHRVGIYFAVVQLFFTLTWTVYVIYLPKLAVQAGIPKQSVVYILMLDQLVFVVMDFAMGVMADRVSRVLGRLGYIVLGVTLFSCAAFLLLPFLAPQGNPALFLAATALWAASSSALRAPPLALLGKYAPEPSVPWLAALALFGLGIASAISPYLAIVLREMDPRIPFVLSTVALALATLGIVWAERTLSKTPGAPAPAVVTPSSQTAPWMFWFLLAVLLLGLAFQVHFSLNSASLYLRYARAEQLPYLMPVFWIGFNVFMLPASFATKRFGGIAVTAAGAILAALGALGAYQAGSLNAVVVMQFIAGAGWGCVLMSATAAAIAVGHTGREGRMTGGLSALFAVAAFARMAVLASGLSSERAYAALLNWVPVVAWTLAGVVLIMLLPRQRKAVPAAAA